MKALISPTILVCRMAQQALNRACVSTVNGHQTLIAALRTAAPIA